MEFVDKSQIPKGFAIISPLSGEIKPLSESTSPLLNQGVLGEGVSVQIGGNKIVAPFDGEVTELPGTNHRIQLKANNGIKLMVLLPQNCEQFHGLGFKPTVKTGQQVTAGQLICQFNPQQLQSLDDQAGAVVVTNPEHTGPIYCSVIKVTAGEDILLTVTSKVKQL